MTVEPPRPPEIPAGESLPQPALPATGVPLPRAKRAYKRRKPFRLTRARRAAAEANLAKAREAFRARGYPHSEKQRAAARENLRKAHQAIRERGLPATPARRESSLRNLERANTVLRERGYPRSEKQIAAARANLSIAHRESRDPANYDRYGATHLKHGLQARLLNRLVFGPPEPRAKAPSAAEAAERKLLGLLEELKEILDTSEA
jgi:hypothetical protein